MAIVMCSNKPIGSSNDVTIVMAYESGILIMP